MAIAGPAAGEVTRRAASDFHRRALVDGAVEPGGAYAVPLTAETIAAYRKGGELRVFDAAGREIPSLVHSAASQSRVESRPVTIFNRAYTEDGTQTLSVEIEGRKPDPVNEFVFDIADEDYNVRVRVEAGQDGEHWQIVRDGLHLIRFTVKKEGIAYRHNVLRIPTSRYRFYRFTLRPTLPGEGLAGTESPLEEPLRIDGVAVREVVRRASSVLTVRAPTERVDDPRDDDARHHYWTLDLGRESLGVDHVSVTIPDTDYARSASLWEWSPERRRRTRQLASAVFFQYGDDAHTEFADFSTDARMLVVMIDQGDDTPVRVTGARASRPRQQVRFLGPAAVSLPLALHFDPDVPREPKYDLARRLREHQVASFTELAAAPLEENPAYAKPVEPLSERVPLLLYAIVIPLVAGLGWYVARTIRRGVPPEDAPSA